MTGFTVLTQPAGPRPHSSPQQPASPGGAAWLSPRVRPGPLWPCPLWPLPGRTLESAGHPGKPVAGVTAGPGTESGKKLWAAEVRPPFE
jgi:hypothetical protein